MERRTITRRARLLAATVLAVVGLFCAVVAAAGFSGAPILTPNGAVSALVAGDGAGSAPAATRRADDVEVGSPWKVAPGITTRTSIDPANPDAVDASVGSDPVVLEAYVETLTRGNNGRFHGAARWVSRDITYRLSLPADYPDGVGDEVRTAYRWMAETSGITITEITSGHADINVVGYHHNGGLTHFDAIGGQLGNVTVSIGCCRRRPVWEEALHSMGLYADSGPAGSLVADYSLRDEPVEVPTAADATVLRALYDETLRPGSGRDEVRAALIDAAGR